MTRRILALIVWAGALVAVWGATIVAPNVMGTGLIIAALALLAYGLAAALDERPNLAEYRAAVWARRDQEAAEGELPHLPVNEGELTRPDMREAS